jgi:Mycothiol maleylpyruvate isomerase N-terminal domain
MTTDAYLSAARSAAELLHRPEVAAVWDKPSALTDFTVRGLAGHLAKQVFNVTRVLSADDPSSTPIGLLDHYARVAWIGADLDDPVNVSTREDGERIAVDGPAALAVRVDAAVSSLAASLPAEPAGRVVFLPWTGWSLTLPDFLITRMMEIAVHSDDLAVSAAVPTPTLPDDVLRPVLRLLSDLAVRRHGQAEVLRALSRVERAPRSIAAF